MFEIYKFEYDNDFISRDELESYIGMGLITQDEYKEIAGDDNEEAQPTTGQSVAPAQTTEAQPTTGNSATTAQTDSKPTNATTDANGK